MTISVALVEAGSKLQPKHVTCAFDRDLGRLEAEILLAHVLGKDRAWLIAHGMELLRPDLYRKFQGFVRRRSRNEPTAYILGYKEFYGRNFRVTRDTLIPRPETELMVDAIIDRAQHTDRKTAPFIWDIGTGSGALAITLAKEVPTASVLATDVNGKALAIARLNARQLDAASRIRFGQANLLDKNVKTILQTAAEEYPVLIIAANLPYLPNADRKTLDADVVMYEPQAALFAGRDGTELIAKLFKQLTREFPSLGFTAVDAFFEFDPPQAASLKSLAKKIFPKAKVAIHKDLAKRNRLLILSLR